MTNFTLQEFQQIRLMTQDFRDFMFVFARSIPGLSLTAFDADMLAIRAKCEANIAELEKISKPPAKGNQT